MDILIDRRLKTFRRFLRFLGTTGQEDGVIGAGVRP